MHAEISGQGPTVVFLHGGGVSGWMWRPTLSHLGGDFRTVVPDFPGHGRSGDFSYLSHKATIAGLAELIEREAPVGALIVGFSLGAQLAIQLASERPELVRGVIVISGETIPAPMPRATLALLSWTAPLARREWFAHLQAKQLAVPPELLDEYVRDSRNLTRETLLASISENIRFTLPTAWSRYPGRVTIVVGANERSLMRNSAVATHEAAPGSNLVVIEGSAHDTPLTQPEIIASLVREAASSGDL